MEWQDISEFSRPVTFLDEKAHMEYWVAHTSDDGTPKETLMFWNAIDNCFTERGKSRCVDIKDCQYFMLLPQHPAK